MTTPITPMELFREFSAMEDGAEGSARLVYSTAVDLVDGMLKGAMMEQWADIYGHIREAAKRNRDMYVTMSEHDSEEALAWNEVMGILDLALETVDS